MTIYCETYGYRLRLAAKNPTGLIVIIRQKNVSEMFHVDVCQVENGSHDLTDYDAFIRYSQHIVKGEIKEIFKLLQVMDVL